MRSSSCILKDFSDLVTINIGILRDRDGCRVIMEKYFGVAGQFFRCKYVDAWNSRLLVIVEPIEIGGGSPYRSHRIIGQVGWRLIGVMCDPLIIPIKTQLIALFVDDVDETRLVLFVGDTLTVMI